MKTRKTPKYLGAALAAPFLLTTSSQAVLVIAGVTDGDLPGGIPKSIILQAGAAVGDLSLWGVGSANNGGGTDGEEFTLPAGTAAVGDVIVIAGNTDSFDFFANNFVQNFTLLLNGAANINGDDAIELFNNGSVFDVYGDPNRSRGWGNLGLHRWFRDQDWDRHWCFRPSQLLQQCLRFRRSDRATTYRDFRGCRIHSSSGTLFSDLAWACRAGIITPSSIRAS